MKKRLVEIYDEHYDEVFGKILLKLTDRELAKKLLGQIFRDTWDMLLTVKRADKDGVKLVFSQVMMGHGIV